VFLCFITQVTIRGKEDDLQYFNEVEPIAIVDMEIVDVI
jgi:hypothetical protein